jgi:hypothetical protein
VTWKGVAGLSNLMRQSGQINTRGKGRNYAGANVKD